MPFWDRVGLRGRTDTEATRIYGAVDILSTASSTTDTPVSAPSPLSPGSACRPRGFDREELGTVSVQSTLPENRVADRRPDDDDGDEAANPGSALKAVVCRPAEDPTASGDRTRTAANAH